MNLVQAAVDHRTAAAEPKDRISGCSSTLPEGLREKKVRLNFLSSQRFDSNPQYFSFGNNPTDQ